MEDNLKKGDTVIPTNVKYSRETWNVGRVIKFDTDEEEVQIETETGKSIWLFIEEVEKY